MKSKKMVDCLNRFHDAMHDNKDRPVCIPAAVLEACANAAAKEKKKLEKDLENDNGGAGVYSASLKKHYILANDEWTEDVLPEILDGRNVADFPGAGCTRRF
jgi:nucleolar GTP-binding protein